ncbi:hypothetical protein [Puniceicoccus vermicola]|uniref:Uncharacterized protein n=1 Tax=Puniceicoccus vermicola TaxID=388746 RepID=A0A7X1E366_9BACT|nr:hypothetical protein [Puniceicoccus vermicola]MBC2600634.1 hypothetical protein [Puniceicoccus vermicola]
MKKIKCISPDETFFIYKTAFSGYVCPVCGEAGLKERPYDDDGSPSFEMCTCGFEFGFDDSPLASKEAVNGIKENWKRWRVKVIEEAATNRESLKQLEANLRNINIRLAFDLIPVEIEKDEQDGTGQRR